jgi:NF-X1-type zinc finger protein NFXL1
MHVIFMFISGPCPPCPKMVKTACFCGNQPPRLQRCSNKTWSCGSLCRRMLGCGRHECVKVCHPEECPPCPKTSVQSCECGKQKVLRPCAAPKWQCEQVNFNSTGCNIRNVCNNITHWSSGFVVIGN